MLKDPIKRREYMRSYYLSNKDKILLRSKNFYEENKLEKLEYGRKYHLKNIRKFLKE